MPKGNIEFKLTPYLKVIIERTIRAVFRFLHLSLFWYFSSLLTYLKSWRFEFLRYLSRCCHHWVTDPKRNWPDPDPKLEQKNFTLLLDRPSRFLLWQIWRFQSGGVFRLNPDQTFRKPRLPDPDPSEMPGFGSATQFLTACLSHSFCLIAIYWLPHNYGFTSDSIHDLFEVLSYQ